MDVGMNRLDSSHTNVVPSVKFFEAALGEYGDPLLDIARNETEEDLHLMTFEAVLSRNTRATVC